MKNKSHTRLVVLAALAGNSLIAMTKFAAAYLTGSSAMLSEAIHSVVDTGNQGLLLYGMRRAKRRADAQHPFGYGMELYFWSFVVAILIFGLGAGLSLYEGITHLLHPAPVVNPAINYLVIAFALIFEGAAWLIALREFRKTKGAMSYLAAVRHSKDPAVFTVLFEDSAAMLGLLAALAGVFFADYYNMPELDGAASIVIGLILAMTAALLAFETKGLLIGERAGVAVVSGIRNIVQRTPGIHSVNELLTMHMGPEDILLNMSLDFADGLDSSQVEKTISQLEQQIKQDFPEIKRIFIEAQNWRAHMAGLATEEEG